MRQLSPVKKRKMLAQLKGFQKRYLCGRYADLDESATRLMINEFLANILGFASLDEIKTEYMIRGTYADYIIQMKGRRFFIVEVKAMPIELSEKHLRQAVNYAANEGIEWALLTNGRQFDFYKIFFNKPIECRPVFSVDLADKSQLRLSVECFQYLTRELAPHRGLDNLWHRVSALAPMSLSRLLCSKPVINLLTKKLKKTYKHRFDQKDVVAALVKLFDDKTGSHLGACKSGRQSRKVVAS